MERWNVPAVDLNELCKAMENCSRKYNYYLALKTGDIVLVSDRNDDQETRKLIDKIRENPDRYEPIPKAASRQIYEDMEDFIVTVKDGHIAEEFYAAIDSRGAFRHFIRVLEAHPDEKKSWLRFKNSRLKKRATEWLEDTGITIPTK